MIQGGVHGAGAEALQVEGDPGEAELAQAGDQAGPAVGMDQVGQGVTVEPIDA